MCPGCGTPVDAVRAYGEWIAAQDAEVEEAADQEAGPVRVRGRRRAHRFVRPRRRRALLATAGIALVAGGVGLGVAQLGEGSLGDGSHTQAAPDISAAPTKGADTVSPSATAERSTPPASRASRTSSAPASKSPRPERTRASSGPVDAEATHRATRSAPATSEPGSSASSRPTPSASRSPSATPTAEPDPSATCDRFLWWCT
nr:hypothetical protein [Streptomyces endophyticus]